MLLLEGDTHIRRARFALGLRIGFHLIMLSVVAAEAFHSILPHLASILILIAAIGSIITLTYSRHAHTTARYYRINLLLTDSLGLGSSDLDNHWILTGARGSAPPAAVRRMDAYYSSRLPVGPARLKASLAETIFFASHLWKHSAKRLFAFIILPSLLFLLTAVVAPLLQAETTQMLDRLVILIVAFLSEIHLATEMYEMSDASRRGLELLARLTHADTENNIELTQILCAYCAIACSAPAPYQSLYERHRSRLNALWDVERYRYEMRPT